MCTNGQILEWDGNMWTCAEDQIGSVTPNSVGSAEIIDGSVGKDDIGTDAVGKDEIKINGVGIDEIRKNAVGTEELVDGSVTAEKLAPGVGVLVPTGVLLAHVICPRSPGGGPNYCPVELSCPAGQVAIGGGVNISYVQNVNASVRGDWPKNARTWRGNVVVLDTAKDADVEIRVSCAIGS